MQIQQELLDIFYYTCNFLSVRDIHSLRSTCSNLSTYLKPKMLSKAKSTIDSCYSKYNSLSRSNIAISMGYIRDISLIKDINEETFLIAITNSRLFLIPQLLERGVPLNLFFSYICVRNSIITKKLLLSIIPKIRLELYNECPFKEEYLISIPNIFIFWIYLEIREKFQVINYLKTAINISHDLPKLKYYYKWLKSKNIEIDWKKVNNCPYQRELKIKRWLDKIIPLKKDF